MNVQDLAARILDELRTVFEQVDPGQVEVFTDLIVRANRVFLTGAGRPGTSTRGFAFRLTHLGKTTHWVLDDTTPRIREGDLLIANSGWGSSPSTLNLVNKADSAGAMLATITANPDGQIAQLADAVIHLPAQTFHADRSAWASILPLGSQFELALWILQDIVSLALMKKMNVTEEAMGHTHRNLE